MRTIINSFFFLIHFNQSLFLFSLSVRIKAEQSHCAYLLSASQNIGAMMENHFARLQHLKASLSDGNSLTNTRLLPFDT